MDKSIRSRVWRVWRTHLQPIVVMIVVLTAFRSAVADWNDVPSGSMRPSIIEGDRILVNKLAYGLKVPFTTWHLARWNVPERGEIVVFNSPVDGTRLVKRVVGVPGDVIQMIDNHLLVNGQPVRYDVRNGHIVETLGEMKHEIQVIPQVRALRSFGPVAVPAGRYFMLGDNRDNSHDSRFYGTVGVDQIVGRSSAVAVSFDYDNYYLPRWERLFHSID